MPKVVLPTRLIDDLWRAKAATSPRSLAAILLSEDVLESTRKELRRQTAHNIDVKELGRLLQTSVLRDPL